ncbi:hypothetical protein BCR34DRAFT_227850 [Clohesyomyces aquaticus]|uniref:Uncharacterized protein n=1 Tax=Clohesyomyces aquaticus TaxID=1231657 RepID=A0A1Y1ZW82_9PLEO|nr:hypothetical protein BCR34DRAFT_227850 [Clohesyomyces aquaticus]
MYHARPTVEQKLMALGDGALSIALSMATLSLSHVEDHFLKVILVVYYVCLNYWAYEHKYYHILMLAWAVIPPCLVLMEVLVHLIFRPRQTVKWFAIVWTRTPGSKFRKFSAWMLPLWNRYCWIIGWDSRDHPDFWDEDDHERESDVEYDSAGRSRGKRRYMRDIFKVHERKDDMRGEMGWVSGKMRWRDGDGKRSGKESSLVDYDASLNNMEKGLLRGREGV